MERPIDVNPSGFDPSLFHDDGRKWFVNMPAFDGILLQEWDPVMRRLVGPVRNIYPGTALGLVEGPHRHKRNGWYYLTVAEGGTSYEHAVTMARSRSIWGPDETHPRTQVGSSGVMPGRP